MTMAEGTPPSPPGAELDPGPTPAPAPPTGELLAGVPWGALTLTNAFEAAFRGLARPAFIGPILLISCLVSAFMELVVTPGLQRVINYSPGGRPTIQDLDEAFLLLAITFVVGLAGGILVAVYGQVWAAAASRGPLPDVGAASELAGRRWVSLVGVSIVITLVVIAVVLVSVLVMLAIGPSNLAVAFLVVIALIVPFVWLQLRLSMATWLAADGHSVRASLRGTWEITQGNVLRIFGWTLATGLAFGLLSAGLGAALTVVPLVGAGIAQGIGYVLTYGAAVTLYRRTLAASTTGPRAAIG